MIFLACSSVIGSLNLMDIPFGAVYIAKLAYAVAGEKMPEPWGEIAKSGLTVAISNFRDLRMQFVCG